MDNVRLLNAKKNSADLHASARPVMAPVQSADAQITTPTDAPTDDERVARRMNEIAGILAHAAIEVLEKCELVAEWVKFAEARVSGLPVQKGSKTGRPEGGVARASRELPVPGKTPEAKRKYVERAVNINTIEPSAKAAARAGGLADTRSALLAIAAKRSETGQLSVVKALVERKALPRKMRIQKASGAGSDELKPIELSAEQETALSALRAAWLNDRQLKRDAWESADAAVRRGFLKALATEVV